MEKDKHMIKTPLLGKSLDMPSQFELLSFRSEINSVPTNLDSNWVRCATCSTMLAYSRDMHIARCPVCRNLTAIKPVSQMVCSRCEQILLFPSDVKIVTCTCGESYEAYNGNAKQI
ncbi:unnamed protein product [Blepharisma stoltei]|uniref:Phosphatidylinositol-4,5-bisphosphate 4-phosphatase n=1 Tax=Blepharisma stoltei TaxID=1481888 RepID=A0AAU9IBP3_9CILI|nr:unnamed protein product [Blepharisma stoltei]